MSNEAGKTARTVGIIIFLTLLGKLTGLFRDQLLAWNYGTSMEANAFLTASRIPRVFFDAVFASAISASFIPVFNEYLEKRGKKDAFSLSNQFITLIILVTTIMTVLGIIFSKSLVLLFAKGLDNNTVLLCVSLIKILFPAIIFTGAAFSFVGILQSLEEFNIPAAMSVVSNLVIIVYYLFFNDKFGIYGLTIAFLLGWAMQAIIQIPPLIKKGYKLKLDFNFKNNEGLKKILVLMVPVMISTWSQPINILINTRFASNLYEGSGIAFVEYANNLYSIIIGVLVLSIANFIFPRLSRLSENNSGDFGATIGKTIETMAFIIIPMTIGLMLLSVPVVRLFFERGNFSQVDAEITGNALFYYSLGMLGFGIHTILSRGFYAEQNGKIPFFSGIIAVVVNLLLSMLLVNSMKINGLALASALSSMAAALCLLIPMTKKHRLFNKGIIIELIKMVISALIMGIPVYFVRELLIFKLSDSTIARVIILVLPTICGIITYGITSAILKIKQIEVILGVFKGIIKRS